jgi:2-succinyl-5-enolpyruvyl-6-hydroxy-3-cyclohexene-1-carboxylate synthase
MNQATRLARVIVRQIIEAGITDAVISPGSRNAPLSLALVTAQDLGLISESDKPPRTRNLYKRNCSC